MQLIPEGFGEEEGWLNAEIITRAIDLLGIDFREPGYVAFERCLRQLVAGPEQMTASHGLVLDAFVEAVVKGLMGAPSPDEYAASLVPHPTNTGLPIDARIWAAEDSSRPSGHELCCELFEGEERSLVAGGKATDVAIVRLTNTNNSGRKSLVLREEVSEHYTGETEGTYGFVPVESYPLDSLYVRQCTVTSSYGIGPSYESLDRYRHR